MNGKLFELSDATSVIHLKLEEVRSLTDLLQHEYVDPIPMKMEAADVSRMQYNMITLFELIGDAIEKAEKAKTLAEELFNSSKIPA